MWKRLLASSIDDFICAFSMKFKFVGRLDPVLFGSGVPNLGPEHCVVNRVDVSREGVIRFVVVPHQEIPRRSMKLSGQVAFVGSRPSSKSEGKPRVCVIPSTVAESLP